MKNVDFMTTLHKRKKRDYLARVNDKQFPKAKAAQLAKKFDFDYWDGDRRICYGGYKYIEGRWEKVARKLIEHYQLKNDAKILDIGCGKGYLLFDLMKLLPDLNVYGLDVSRYAVENSKKEIKETITVGNATNLPFKDDFFDLVISINTLHCLEAQDLYKALKEMERVGKKDKYLCVESYRNENEKANSYLWSVWSYRN